MTGLDFNLRRSKHKTGSLPAVERELSQFLKPHPICLRFLPSTSLACAQLVGPANGIAAMGNGGQLPAKSNAELPWAPAIPHLGKDPKQLEQGLRDSVTEYLMMPTYRCLQPGSIQAKVRNTQSCGLCQPPLATQWSGLAIPSFPFALPDLSV